MKATIPQKDAETAPKGATPPPRIFIPGAPIGQMARLDQPGSSAYSELEQRLFGTRNSDELKNLIASLERDAEQLQQLIGSVTLDPGRYSLVSAYLDAVEAALGFLATIPARR